MNPRAAVSATRATSATRASKHFAHDWWSIAGVLLLPASMYRSDLIETPADRFRIGYGREGIDEALEAFEEFLSGAVRLRTFRIPGI